MKLPAIVRLLSIFVALFGAVALVLTLTGARDYSVFSCIGLIVVCAGIYALAGVKRRR